MSDKTIQQTLRRYHLTAERIDRTTYQAEVCVIVASLPAAGTEEERARLIDQLEGLIR